MSSQPANADHPLAKHKWWAMLGIGMGVLMSTIDASIVNIALPTLVDELGTTLSTVEWVVLSYLLVLTASMLGVARLGDMHGKKRIYLIGLVCFTISSLLCGMAPNVHWLIAFRAIQGIGAVMNQALGSAIITEVFPRSERGRALGIIGSTVSVGISLGPTVGGLIIGLINWRAAFFINVPLGIATAIIVARMVPDLPPHGARPAFRPGRGVGALCHVGRLCPGHDHGPGTRLSAAIHPGAAGVRRRGNRRFLAAGMDPRAPHDRPAPVPQSAAGYQPAHGPDRIPGVGCPVPHALLFTERAGLSHRTDGAAAGRRADLHRGDRAIFG